MTEEAERGGIDLIGVGPGDAVRAARATLHADAASGGQHGGGHEAAAGTGGAV
jgi:hypothetical protein